MFYKITSATQNEQNVNLFVEFTFDDESTKIVNVSIFAPEDIEDIHEGIYNRGISEKNAKSNEEAIPNILAEIVINEVIEIVE